MVSSPIDAPRPKNRPLHAHPTSSYVFLSDLWMHPGDSDQLCCCSVGDRHQIRLLDWCRNRPITSMDCPEPQDFSDNLGSICSYCKLHLTLSQSHALIRNRGQKNSSKNPNWNPFNTAFWPASSSPFCYTVCTGHSLTRNSSSISGTRQFSSLACLHSMEILVLDISLDSLAALWWCIGLSGTGIICGQSIIISWLLRSILGSTSTSCWSSYSLGVVKLLICRIGGETMRIIVRGVLRSVIKSGAEAVEGLVTLNDIFGLENQSRLMNRMREIYLVLKLCCSMISLVVFAEE